MSTRTAEPLWKPSPQRAANSRLADLTAILARRTGRPVVDYATAHRISVTEPEVFWGAVWDDCGVIAGSRGEHVLTSEADISSIRWFPDARLNYAENLLRRRDEGPAVIDHVRTAGPRRLSWSELHDLVSRMQQSLRRHGVGAGDRVGVWAPGICEAQAAMLAAVSIGAVFCAVPVDAGPDQLVAQLGAVGAKVLFTVDGCRRVDGTRDHLGLLGDLKGRLPTVTTWVVVPHLDPALTVSVPGVVTLEGFTAEVEATRVAFERLPFDHPLCVVFDTLDDGASRPVVHRAGGVLLKHLVEHQYHCDVRSGDRVLEWGAPDAMARVWSASSMASGATTVLVDPEPGDTGLQGLFGILDDLDVTLVGVHVDHLAAMRRADLRPDVRHGLFALRTITTHGPVPSPDLAGWVYGNVKADVHLAATVGGVDAGGALAGGDPTAAVWPGEAQRPALGVAVDVVDDDGVPLSPGRPGAIVSRCSFPSLPLGFWDDDDGSRFRADHFARIDGLWVGAGRASWGTHGGIVGH